MNKRTQLSRKILSMMITEKYQKRLRDHLRYSSRSKMIRKVCQDKEALIRDLNNTCLKHLEPITVPLVLITSLPFSGGTDLNRLFDGHPQIMVLPDDIMIGRTLKHFDLAPHLDKEPQQLFESISAKVELVGNDLLEGQGTKGYGNSPFVFLPHLQKLLFVKALETKEIIRKRDVYDAYMTSIFGAWLNCQVPGPDIKYVTAFLPRMAVEKANIENFIDIYPNGKLIFLIKDPKDWYSQALLHEPDQNKEISASLDCWNKYAISVMETKRKYQDRVCIINCKDLVADPEDVMHYLAGFLGIAYQDILLKPTFNRIPVAPGQEFRAEIQGTLDDEAIASSKISADQIQVIAELTNEVYQEVLRRVGVSDPK